MREPSDLSELYTYWHLALESWPQAEAWRRGNEMRLAQWDGMPAIFPGWYRARSSSLRDDYAHVKGKFVPIVIWLEQPLDEAGELLDAEVLKIKVGHGKPVDEFTAEFSEASLWMTWNKCRRHAVSKEAYDYAMRSYAERSVYEWADNPPEPPPKPAPVDLARARPVF